MLLWITCQTTARVGSWRFNFRSSTKWWGFSPLRKSKGKFGYCWEGTLAVVPKILPYIALSVYMWYMLVHISATLLRVPNFSLWYPLFGQDLMYSITQVSIQWSRGLSILISFSLKLKDCFFLPSLKMKNKLPSNEGRCRGYVWKPEVQDVVDTSDVLQAGQSISKATLR